MDYKELQHLRRLQKEYGLPFVPKDIWKEAVLYSGNHLDDDDTLVFWIRNLMDLDEEENGQYHKI